MEGRTFERSKESREPEGSRLTIGASGASFVCEPQISTVFFDRLAGVGWRDGVRVLISNEDTVEVAVVASDWIRGGDAVASVDAAVDPDLFIPLDGSAPQDRVPPPPPPPPPRRGPKPLRAKPVVVPDQAGWKLPWRRPPRKARG